MARRRGLDGNAVTNHDVFRADTLVDVSCLPGIEITTTKGHLLVVGPDPPSRTQSATLEPADAVDLAYDHGCAAIIAHPFRNSTLHDSDADFDAIEINRNHPEHRQRVEAIATERDLPIVRGIDAHLPFEAGRVSTRLDIDQLTPTTVVDAIRDGRVKPVFRDGPLLRGIWERYDRIHPRRGHL